MNPRTTVLLLLAVLVMAGALFYHDYRGGGVLERDAQSSRIIDASADNLDYLHIVSGELDLVLLKSGKRWFVEKPIQFRASAGRVEHFLNELQTLARADVVSRREQKSKGLDLQQFGLEHPRAMITYGQGDARRTLFVGRSSPAGNRQYMRLDDEPDILVADRILDDLLPSSVEELRDRVVFSMGEFDVGKVELKRDEGFLQLVRLGHSGWTIQQPVQIRADRKSASELIRKLGELKVETFLPQGPADLSGYGFEGASRITLYRLSSEESETLVLGDPVGDQPGLQYGMLQEFPAVFTISTSAQSAVHVRVQDIRDRRVLPLRSDDIRAFEIIRAEESVAFALQERGWKMTRPEGEEIEKDLVRRLVDDWSGLVAETFYQRAFTGIPPVRVVFQSGQEAGLRVQDVEIGIFEDLETGRWLGRLAGDISYFEVPAELYAQLFTAPLAYRKREILDIPSGELLSFDVQWLGRQTGGTLDEDGNWVYAAAGSGFEELETNAVGSFVAMFAPLTTLGYLSEQPDSAESFGLDAPELRVRFKLTGRAGLLKTLLVGKPLANGIHPAMIAGRDLVFSLSAEQLAVLQSVFPPMEEPEGRPDVEVESDVAPVLGTERVE